MLGFGQGWVITMNFEAFILTPLDLTRQLDGQTKVHIRGTRIQRHTIPDRNRPRIDVRGQRSDKAANSHLPIVELV